MSTAAFVGYWSSQKLNSLLSMVLGMANILDGCHHHVWGAGRSFFVGRSQLETCNAAQHGFSKRLKQKKFVLFFVGKPRRIQVFLLTSLWTTCCERLQNWKWGERSEVKELVFLHNMTLSQWQLSSHDLLLCSHNDKSPKDTEECFRKENRRLCSQQFLWKVCLTVSYKILYLKCQIKQSVLKGKLPKQSQTLISSRLMEYRQNYENRLATQSLNVEVPGQGKLRQLACCANDMPVWYSSWIAPWLPIIWLCTFWVALKKNLMP